MNKSPSFTVSYLIRRGDELFSVVLNYPHALLFLRRKMLLDADNVKLL
jgi:hypothetical protein